MSSISSYDIKRKPFTNKLCIDVHVRNVGINCPARQTLIVPNTFRNEETDILPELDKFDYIYIIAGKKFVTLTVFRERMINDEDLRQC
jgi:hypothetical protein